MTMIGLLAFLGPLGPTEVVLIAIVITILVSGKRIPELIRKASSVEPAQVRVAYWTIAACVVAVVAAIIVAFEQYSR